MVMVTQVEKVTISLPRNLIRFADEVASERKVSRSKVVSSCLQEFADRRLREQMEEGYKAMAEEHRQFANMAINLAHEVLPEWE
jgi:metal-responsive CopG/Arc/MetJ family transcriptional regulator